MGGEQDTVYSYQLRMLLCVQCGAALEGRIDGGHLTCRYCQAVMVLEPRVAHRPPEVARAAEPITESERLRLLREQDGYQPMPPRAIAPLFVNGALPLSNVHMALDELQRARRDLHYGSTGDAAERFSYLTLALYRVYSRARQHLHIRALLETARDLPTESSHNNSVHALIAREAARAGDIAAAETWLSFIDSRSTNLHVDTAYRLSRAFIDTRRGDYGAVLSVLGATRDEVPIADEHDDICALLRANALERSGSIENAVAHLSLMFSSDVYPVRRGWLLSLTGGLPKPNRLKELAAANSELDLCPRSLPTALERGRQITAVALPPRPGFYDPVPLIIGALVILGAAAAEWWLSGTPQARDFSRSAPLIYNAGIIFGFIGPVIAPALVELWAKSTGTAATARVLRATKIASDLSGNYSYLELLLLLERRYEPGVFIVHRKWTFRDAELATYRPGNTISVRYLPKSPRTIAIDLLESQSMAFSPREP